MLMIKLFEHKRNQLYYKIQMFCSDLSKKFIHYEISYLFRDSYTPHFINNDLTFIAVSNEFASYKKKELNCEIAYDKII